MHAPARQVENVRNQLLSLLRVRDDVHERRHHASRDGLARTSGKVSLADLCLPDRLPSHSNALLENPRFASAFTNSVPSSNCISLAIVSSAEACSPAM